MIKEEVWFRLNPGFELSYCHTPTNQTIRPSKTTANTSEGYFNAVKGSKISNFTITFGGSLDRAMLQLDLYSSGRYLSGFTGIVNKNIFVFDVNIELLRDSEISLSCRIDGPSSRRTFNAVYNEDLNFYVDKITMNGSN